MPRVYHRKAAKDYPEAGIKKGQMYFTWKFRYRPRMKSLTRPKPEDLTQSEYLQQLYPLTRQVEGFTGSSDDLENLAQEVRDLGDEQQEKLYNMPDHLQDTSEAGELLQMRADACEAAADELDTLVYELQEADQALEKAEEDRAVKQDTLDALKAEIGDSDDEDAQTRLDEAQAQLEEAQEAHTEAEDERENIIQQAQEVCVEDG